MIILRDNKTIHGILSSYDQFGNIWLEKTYERTIVKGDYKDISLGLYIIKSEHVSIICEIEKEEKQKVNPKEIKKIDQNTQRKVFKNNGIIMTLEDD